MRAHGSIWALHYALLRSVDGLLPNFLHKLHGLARDDQIGEKRDFFDIEWVTELLVAILTFHHSDKQFPTGEALKMFTDQVNSDTYSSHIRCLKGQFLLRLDRQSGFQFASPEEFMRQDFPLMQFLSESDMAKLKIARKSHVTVESLRYTMSSLQKKVESGELAEEVYEEFYQVHGVMVYVYDTVLSIISDDTIEDLDQDITSSYALRSNKRDKRKFNIAKGLKRSAKSCHEALHLIEKYEEMLFKTSACAQVQWSKSRLNNILQMINKRTNDKSNWDETCMETNELPNEECDEEEVLDVNWGAWNKNDEKPSIGGRKRLRRSLRVHGRPGAGVRQVRWFYIL